MRGMPHMGARHAVGFSLASINLHCGLDHRGKPYAVSEAVGALSADIIVVQENWRPRGSDSLARRAAAECGYGEYAELDLVAETTLSDLNVVRGTAPEETGAWGLAVLSRLPWRSFSMVGLGSARGDVVGPRFAQVVEIPVGADAVLRVVNAHLTHRLVHGPGQLRRLVGALVPSEVPTVIVGDLNMCRPTVYLARPFRPVVRGVRGRRTGRSPRSTTSSSEPESR